MSEMNMFICNACGETMPEKFRADVNVVDTGGDRICCRCHVECCPEDADILSDVCAEQELWFPHSAT